MFVITSSIYFIHSRKVLPSSELKNVIICGGIDLEYFESGHGKGAANGIGGSIKKKLSPTDTTLLTPQNFLKHLNTAVR